MNKDFAYRAMREKFARAKYKIGEWTNLGVISSICVETINKEDVISYTVNNKFNQYILEHKFL